MTATPALRRIGIFGGTFDPVHNGHLRTALEVRKLLGLEELRLVPCNQPATRGTAQASAADRLQMLRLAVAGSPQLQADDCEVRRGGISYSIDTLRVLRAQLAAEDRLCMILGADAFAALDHWKDWQRLSEYAHIVVLARPDTPLQLSPALAAWREHHLAIDAAQMLEQAPCGALLELRMTQLAISATQVRALIASGQSPRFLVPDVVLAHIAERRLYAAATNNPEDSD